jgi:hypothetical protein
MLLGRTQRQHHDAVALGKPRAHVMRSHSIQPVDHVFL